MGQTSCKRCIIGEYQDQKGQARCIPCVAGTTTLGDGRPSVEDCGCIEGRAQSAVVPCGTRAFWKSYDGDGMYYILHVLIYSFVIYLFYLFIYLQFYLFIFYLDLSLN